MILETARLILRPWEESDAESLFQYARNPKVGPIAGWPPHKTIEDSLFAIRNVFAVPECYAVCLKEDNKAIGCIQLKMGEGTDMTEKEDECELGYWIGEPFWGQGLIPEASEVLIRHGFEELGMKTIWCGYYEGNEKSKRVQEKIGFAYLDKVEEVKVPVMGEIRTLYKSYLTKEEWIKKEKKQEI